MKSHDYVTLKWPRCRSVELQGEHLVYTVDWQRTYDLSDRRPELHIRFLNLKTDQELLEFMGAWGPLWQEVPDGGKPKISVPRSQYWAFQRTLKAEVALVQSCELGGTASLKAALCEYIAAEDASNALHLGGESIIGPILSAYIGKPDLEPEDWIPTADISRLREAALFCVGGHFNFRMRGAWQHGKLQMAWEPAINTLGDAIQLELWNSFAGARPLTICRECQTIFAPESAHLRKYCSYPCAHRAAVRMWRKNNAEGQAKRKRGKHAKAKKV